VGGSEAKKGLGSDLFFVTFYRVFELPSPRNAQKRDKQNRERIGFGFLVEFFVKTFRHDFFCKTFFVVLLNSHRRETPETTTKQKSRGKTDNEIFVDFREKFSAWTFCKNICMVFLNSPSRETPKNVL
jgi:hypothetical protein